MGPSSEVQRLIEDLELRPHPEGGWYREIHRSAITVQAPRGPRAAITTILYLLAAGQFSRWHAVDSDEVWHFYDGASLTLYVIAPDGALRELVLGRDAERGEALQAVVPAGAWYGAVVGDPASYSLVGGTVAPGFDFADFELAERRALLREFPQHRGVIERLTAPDRA